MSEVDKSTQQKTESKPKAKKPSRSQLRSASRSFALQAAYQWQMNQTPVNEIEAQFTVDHDLGTCDKVYFRELIQGVTFNAKKLDDLYETLLDRPLSELDPIELTILRIGSFELSERLDVPYRVVINEGVELAKSFGATESHKYVNGILDKLAQRVRREEIAARRER
ncbi:transcription antitermination factor NusB [Marinomonas sp. 15G1-11]|uniref:Transcription antitermination protein NusB n=1 Tax=Marinomonas phaeophyticola TaxID=3004091 RepID=A0ABT4JYR7_9GAMM|nr:transcription antitermination factor NusB [Marinomonas sp. 15G1-11]MCZ2723547.1 transcription antitermination factor NusB [Marinomonas sp. 15G1-11]